jgi:hypothetical protein
VIQALTKDDLEKIRYQVKEVTEETFMRAAQKQEEMHMNVQAQIAILQQLLEPTRIAPTKTGEIRKY